MAYADTGWPSEASASIRAKAGPSRTVLKAGVRFRRPARCSRSYVGSMEMPWESTPRRSVSTIMSAVVWACGALMPQAASTETSWRCRASALTWAGMARLRRDVAEELLRRVGAPLAHEPLLHGEEVRSAPRVQPIGVGPALVHPAPGIAPVVVH